MWNNEKKYVPNVITCFRIILSACLLFMNPDQISFLLTYITCGFTDVVDGYLARKWNLNSEIGAMLDSMADFIFITVVFVIFVPRLEWKGWMLWWIGIIAVIRVLSILIGAVRFKTIASIHTYGNKITGLLLFCVPILLQALGLVISVIMICAVASVSAIEELMIIVYSDTLNRDRNGW